MILVVVAGQTVLGGAKSMYNLNFYSAIRWSPSIITKVFYLYFGNFPSCQSVWFYGHIKSLLLFTLGHIL